MQQRLKLKRHLSRILHLQRRLQPALAQRDAVHQPKLVRPVLRKCRPPFAAAAAPGHARRKPKVEFHTAVVVVVVVIAIAGGLGRGFAQVFPGRGSCEAVLWETRGCVVWRGRTEDLVIDNNNRSDISGSVQSLRKNVSEAQLRDL